METEAGFSVRPVTQARDGHNTPCSPTCSASFRRSVAAVRAPPGHHNTVQQGITTKQLDCIMQRVPNFVDIRLQSRVVRALVDSGSDYSLLSEDLLSAGQIKCIEQSQVTAHSAANELLKITGQIFLSVKIGSVGMKSHRFIVVAGLVTGVILGLDFWARVDGFTLDFNKIKLCTYAPATTVSLHSESSVVLSDSGSKRVPAVAVVLKVKHAVSVPPRTEAMISCFTPGLVQSASP